VGHRMDARLIPVRIAGTGSAVPPRTVATSEVVARAFPDSDAAARRQTEEKTGIATRHWVEPGATAAALGAEALGRALAAAELPATELRRIIFVSSTGGDHLVPATAHDVAGLLGLDESCDAFDMNNSCVGFLSALDVGARSVATGLGPVAVVATEIFSRQLSPEGPRAYVVLGDAAAAAVLVPAAEGGILSSHLRSSARLRGKMSMSLPGTAGSRPFHDFDARNRELTESALHCFRRSTGAVLATAGLGMGEIDWVVFHQPNGNLLRALLEALEVPPEKTVSVVEEIGSVGSASVPSALDRLLRTRPVRPGQHILLASVGAGTAYGALLYQVAR
jgi:3-oxoacyl-[acyl-carrier-protein] synthase-3